MAKAEVASGSFIAINFDPKVLCKQGGNMTAVIYQGVPIIAHDRSHLEADRSIYHYLRREFGLDQDEAMGIAQRSTRIKSDYESCVLEDNGSEPTERIKLLLREQGLQVSAAGPGDIMIRVPLTRVYLLDF